MNLRLPALSVLLLAAASCRQSEKPKPASPTAVPTVASTKLLEPEAETFAKYGGSASCRECHAKEFENWSNSNHGMAERPLDPKLDDAAFVPTREISHASQKSTVQKKDGRDEVVTLGYGAKLDAYVAERVIGHDPLRQFLVPAEGGRLQTLELAWDPKKSEWFDVYGTEDRKPGEWGHWTGRGMTWNSQCAACHNTRVRKNYDDAKDAFHTTMAERTVSCEACHGPMKAHNEWQQRNRGAKNDPTLTKLTRDQMFDTCGQCHARRAELTGDFKPGDNFFDHHALTIPDETDTYYPDGQVREEDYEFASFIGSKMHAAGVRCMDCHDPHTAKNVLAGDALCMKCHTAPLPQFPKAPAINPLAHTFHKPESTGARCVSCHMPVTTYMQRHPRHDHGFTIPDPKLTKDFGIPNACNRCHADKDASWADTFTTQWFGEKMNRRTRERATLFAKAKRGDEGARDGLIATLKSDDPAAWKASAALLLDRWGGEPAVSMALQEQLQHESPLVRAAAVHTLGDISPGTPSPARDALRPLLKDPVRSVRVAAAWALRDDVQPDSPVGKELTLMLAHNADQPSGRMQLGQYEFARGKEDAAIAQIRKAIEWDPNSPPFHHDLAIMLSTTGRTAEAVTALEAAIRLDPKQAVYHYELALAFAELQQTDRTITELEQTVKLDPSMSRAWYNLGLARNGKNDTAGAIDALLKGEAANPRDPALPYARATILIRLGKNDEALAAAQQALVLDPQNRDVQQLLRMLMKPPGK